MEELATIKRRRRGLDLSMITPAAAAPVNQPNSNCNKTKLKKMLDLTTTKTATATNRTFSRSCKRPSNGSLAYSLLSPSSYSSFFVVVLGLLLPLLCGLLIGQLEAIKLQPEGREKFYWSGEQFVITCQNNNNIKNVKIRWIGPNGLDITDDRSQRVHAQSSGPHGHRLVVMNATAGVDDGQYKCTLGSTDDRNPREHIEFQLKLYKTTRFLDTPRHLVLPAGQQGIISCKVEFDPNVSSASVSWCRDQKPIEMFNDSEYKVSEYDQTRQLSQLTITPLTKQHDGTYTCRAVAVTTQLSKISDHDIQLETNYAPTFDSSSHTVWVERSHWQSSGGDWRLHAAPGMQRSGNGATGNLYPSAINNGLGGSRQGFGTHQAGGGRLSNKHPAGSLSSMLAANGARRGSIGGETHMDQSSDGPSSSSVGDSMNSSLVRVELRCSCSANPPANIFWTSQNSIYVLTKGEPAHVLEVPTMEIDGHNTTSILTIAYNVGDPDWPNKRDIYTCSASNKLGKASKSYTIEQGDPPPAFNVGPLKQYNPQTTQFKFTLLGPNFDPDSSSAQGSSASQAIVPPVDSFRIRAENPLIGSIEQRQFLSSSSSSPSSSSSAASNGGGSSSHWGSSSLSSHNAALRTRQQAAAELLSVQWQLDQQQQQSLPDLNYRARNVTVNLGKLPSGNQKLYLEAHNAVGWSPNSTYLGEYYIVSAASSLSSLSPQSILLLALSSFIGLITTSTTISSIFCLKRQG